jgi:hypothetical protein
LLNFAKRSGRIADRSRDAARGGKGGRRMKYLFLIIPCVLAIATPIFNYDAPELFGIPFFYWFQMLMVPVSVVCIFAADRIGKA